MMTLFPAFSARSPKLPARSSGAPVKFGQLNYQDATAFALQAREIDGKLAAFGDVIALPRPPKADPHRRRTELSVAEKPGVPSYMTKHLNTLLKDSSWSSNGMEKLGEVLDMLQDHPLTPEEKKAVDAKITDTVVRGLYNVKYAKPAIPSNTLNRILLAGIGAISNHDDLHKLVQEIQQLPNFLPSDEVIGAIGSKFISFRQELEEPDSGYAKVFWTRHTSKAKLREDVGHILRELAPGIPSASVARTAERVAENFRHMRWAGKTDSGSVYLVTELDYRMRKGEDQNYYKVFLGPPDHIQEYAVLTEERPCCGTEPVMITARDPQGAEKRFVLPTERIDKRRGHGEIPLPIIDSPVVKTAFDPRQLS